MTGGTFKRLQAPRYATPTAEQQARVITTRLCPVCHEPRLTRYGKIAPHQRSRDERGAAIWPAVWCAGGGKTAPDSGAAASVEVSRGER